VGAKLLFIKNRNASPTTKTIVNDDDVLGRIVFGGYDNSDMNSAGAEIRAEVDGTPGTNDLPGRLIFLVTPDGNKDPVTALTIVNDGTLISLPTYSKDVGATTRDLLVDNAGLIGYQASSIRFKENVTSIQDISPIYDLDVVEFDYKKGGHSYGLIAEEVEKVMPLLVSYELEFMADGVDDEGADIMVPDYSYPNKIPESVNYSRLIPFLLKSVQELSAKVEALESK
jgi:hypothetical protein